MAVCICAAICIVLWRNTGIVAFDESGVADAFAADACLIVTTFGSGGIGGDTASVRIVRVEAGGAISDQSFLAAAFALGIHADQIAFTGDSQAVRVA